MSSWLIALVGLIYFYVAGELVVKGHYWQAVIFFGYSVSNIGLWKLAQGGT